MAILHVSPELLLEALFRNCCPLTTIEGAGFDAARNLILLDIRGPEVPAAAEVEAICSVERFSVKFRPIGTSVS